MYKYYLFVSYLDLSSNNLINAWMVVGLDFPLNSQLAFEKLFAYFGSQSMLNAVIETVIDIGNLTTEKYYLVVTSQDGKQRMQHRMTVSGIDFPLDSTANFELLIKIIQSKGIANPMIKNIIPLIG